MHNTYNPMGLYLSKNYNCKVRGNDYLNSFIGIHSNTDSRSLITENRFDQNTLGIISYFDRSQEILGNKFYFNSAGTPAWAGYGIFALNATSLIENGMYLYSTHIKQNEFHGIRVGIEVWGSKVLLVDDNKVNLDYHAYDPGPYFSKGIHLDRCTRATLSDNHVIGGATANDGGSWDTGIRTDNCALTRLVCNTTENIHIGFLNGGSALSTYMFDDVMTGYHHRGLVQNQGLLGQQGSPTAPTDVEWDGVFGECHTQTIENPPTMPFYVRNGAFNSTYWPIPFISISTQNSSLYEIIPTLGTATASPYSCPVDFRNADQLIKVISDSIVFSGHDRLALARLAKLEVYEAVKADSLLQLNLVLSDFKKTFATSDLGTLAGFHAKLDWQLPDSVAHALSAKIARLSGVDNIAKHWRNTLLLAFKAWADSDSSTVLSASDSTYLHDVAMLCPYTNGPGVTLARTMLFSPTKEYFSLCNECETPAFTQPNNRIGQESPVQTTATVVQVYPNPTTGKVTVSFDGQPPLRAVLSLSGTDGKVVFTSQLQRQTNEFILGLTPGLYLYKIQGPGMDLTYGKLVVATK